MIDKVYPLRQLNGTVSGGRVLDVGTRRGDFIRILRENIDGIDMTVGIDIGLKDLATAHENHGSPDTVFIAATAGQLPFVDDIFDTVAMANALHHLPEVDQSLREMVRVLKPGGRLVIAEYIRDNPSEQQISLMAMHDLGGEIAQLSGISHRPFYSREEVLDILHSLDIDDFKTAEYTFPEITTDPGEITTSADGFFSGLPGIAGKPSYSRYSNEMVVARLRAVRTGIQRPTQLIALGVKRRDA